jgi:hypothetical protein
VKKGSTLALLQAGIFLVDDVDTAFPADDLAVRGTAFDGGANFHDFSSGKMDRSQSE